MDQLSNAPISYLLLHTYFYFLLSTSSSYFLLPRVEMRQCLMERFNNDSKYFAFILSTRSGGVGINLTGLAPAPLPAPLPAPHILDGTIPSSPTQGLVTLKLVLNIT